MKKCVFLHLLILYPKGNAFFVAIDISKIQPYNKWLFSSLFAVVHINGEHVWWEACTKLHGHQPSSVPQVNIVLQYMPLNAYTLYKNAIAEIKLKSYTSLTSYLNGTVQEKTGGTR